MSSRAKRLYHEIEEQEIQQHSIDENLSTIGVQIPQHLLCATDTYTKDDCDRLLNHHHHHHFFARHRDAPAHFLSTASRSLFSQAQQTQLDTLFAPGWQSNATSPLHALIGTCRTSSSHRTQEYDEYAARDASVGAFIRKAQRGSQLVVSDVQLGKLPLMIASQLIQGPALFQYDNMLQVVTEDNMQYHCLCYAILGTGASGHSYLMCVEETHSFAFATLL